MYEGNEHDGVKVSDEDLARVRELHQIARDALVESNRILSPYMNIDADSIDSVLLKLTSSEVQFDKDGGVPPVQICTEYQSGGACAYVECEPPGATYPC